MEVLAILPLLLIVANSDPVVKTWTFPELIFATGNYSGKKTQEELDYLEDATSQVAEIFGGDGANDSIHVNYPSPSGKSTWTIEEIQAENPKDLSEFPLDQIKTSEEARDVAKQNAISMAYYMFTSGRRKERVGISVGAPGLDISRWNINDLKTGLRDPKTNPALKPYLEDALMGLTDYTRTGGFKNETIVILTPIGLIPHKQKLQTKRKAAGKRFNSTTKVLITQRAKFSTIHPKNGPVERLRL